MPDRKTELILGAVLLLLGLLAGAVWVPLDSETPPIYEFRRQTYIGDALLPMLAALGIALCAVAHVAITLLERGTSDRGGPAFDRHAALFLLSVFALMALSGLVMFWSGPLALALFGPETDPPATYRLMRGTAPWKYLGFSLGGTLLVFGLISLLEGRMRAGRLLIAVLAVGALIAVFDLPFDTLLLPPNGDF